MSHTLDNALAAVQAMRAHGWADAFSGNAFSRYMDDLQRFDEARSRYYSRDKTSPRVFDWVQQFNMAAAFMGEPLPFELKNAPITAKEWEKLTEKAEKLPAGQVIPSYLLDVVDTWVLEAYRLKGLCEVEKGDTVLDCGVFTGNTSAYFAEKAGPKGKVYGFEASTNFFAEYCENVRKLDNVTPVHAAVTDKPGTVRFPSNAGPGAHISAQGDEVPAISIDGFVKERSLTKIDFIKMDIEGAEGAALEGATETIRRFTPKMALSAYHKLHDIIDLPKQVLSICPDYTFMLRHFSCNQSFETVLFCIPGKAGGEQKTKGDETTKPTSARGRAVDSHTADPSAETPSAVNPGALAQLLSFAALACSQGNALHKQYLSLMEVKTAEMQAGRSALDLLHKELDKNKTLAIENIALKSALAKLAAKK